ncbi:hypothetical protein [Reyranella soli]|uniref:Uncharacterized protein n=1 Tax=Reyranella soli TaxID=1230389 RepID=A0A512NJ43_9HYPH|nr:hypothetical protein [Reyranella soli]GEP58969.1 hypothetical protein RSO01_61350 [Reyranella soli]
MTGSAYYKKLDLVDYLDALSPVLPAVLARFTANVKCLAAFAAFASDEATLGQATYFCSQHTSLDARSCRTILKRLARRHDLPRQDPRHEEIADAARAEQAMLSATKFWLTDNRPPEADGLLRMIGETEFLWRTIKYEEGLQYIEYWKIANWDEYSGLLKEGELLARIDAFNRRQDQQEPHDHVAELNEFCGHLLPSLAPELRWLPLAHLGRDIRCGIVEIPTDLRRHFQEIYAARGLSD